MKKLSAILILTVGVFVFGNAQSTESKSVEKNEVELKEKSEHLKVASPNINKKALLQSKEVNNKVSVEKKLQVAASSQKAKSVNPEVSEKEKIEVEYKAGEPLFVEPTKKEKSVTVK